MKHTLLLLIVVAASLSIYFTSCTQDSSVVPVINNNPEEIITIGGGTNSITLYAGQTINAGTVSLDDIDTDNNGIDDVLRVTYNTIDGWQIMEIHFFVGNSLADLPATKNGNPIPGHFPYKFENLNGITTYSFDIPLSAISIVCPGGPFNKVLAAHASLRKLVNGSWQNETGWGDGPRIPSKGGWAEYNTFQLTCDESIISGCNGTETSFAYGGSSATCFSEILVIPSNKWGWTNGPLSQSETPYSFDVYAGAAQCDIFTKGILVGTLNVLYNNGSAIVTWNLNSDHEGTEFHLYVGNDIMPKKNNDYTIAPGQFPINYTVPNGSLATYTRTVNALTGNIYVVAHATVKNCLN